MAARIKSINLKPKQPKSYKLNENLTISEKAHKNLLEYLIDRVKWADEIRVPLVERFRAIDREISGHLILDYEDKKRAEDNARGLGLKPTDVKLPLTLVQIDEAITTLLMMLAPDKGIYNAIAPKEQQQTAKAFTMTMNKHAKLYNHRGNLSKSLGSILKFNIAGWEVDWDEMYGNKLVNNSANQPEIRRDIVQSGNRFKALSMYNTIWDPSVDEIYEIPTKGEFAGTIKLLTPFRAQKMQADGELFNVDRLIAYGATQRHKFYQSPPEISNSFESLRSKVPDWHEVWTGTKDTISNHIENISLKIWIKPKDLGLGSSTNWEIWRFSIGNGEVIMEGRPLMNAHGMLPFGFAEANQDDLKYNTKSYGELLTPFNRFSSFQLNVHQRAARKSLYGITIYNKTKVPTLANDEEGDLSSCKIPTLGDVEDVSKVIKQYYDGPNTDNTLRDINAMDTIMQKVLPTDLLKQVTDLERATRYQAAAVVQGSNRRLYKIATLIDEQALAKTRLMQMYNILQYMTAMEMIDENGELITANPSEFRDADIELKVSDGLSGIDELALQEGMKEILNSILQSQRGSEEIDVVDVINYLTTLWGDNTDFTQFRYKNEFDKLGQQEKQLAFQLFQQMRAQQQQQQGGQPQLPGIQQ